MSQVQRVRHAWFSYLSRIEEGCLDNVEFDQLEHPSEHYALQFESALVVRIREHEEDILDDA